MDILVPLLIVFVVVDIMIVLYIYRKRRGGAFSAAEKQKYTARWQQIQSDKDLRHAVMDADKLLDRLLTHKGYTGPLGEKLKRGGKLFSNLNGVWAAHKLRNRLAHELDAKVSPQEAGRALKQFEQAYRDLGLL